MWSHSVSHKSFARLIYCTKCRRGVFLTQGVIAWRKRVRRRGLQGKLEAQPRGGERQWGLAAEPSTSAVFPWDSGSQTSAGDDAEPGRLLRGLCSITWCLEHLHITSLTWAIAHGPSRRPSKPAAFLYQHASCPDSPSSPSQAALESFFCLSLTRALFQASHRQSWPTVGYQAGLAFPNYSLKNSGRNSAGAKRCCSTRRNAAHRLIGVR